MTQLSIYQLLDYNIPLLINYRNHHLLQLHTRDHLQHKHLKKTGNQLWKLIFGLFPSLNHISMLWHHQSSRNPFKGKGTCHSHQIIPLVFEVVVYTCIPSAHVHICNLLPCTGDRIKHFHAFSYQRTIMTTYRIQ